MSKGTPGEGHLSKNEKREAAREKARVLREQQQKKDRRTKVLLQGGIVLAALAIVAIIAVVIVTSIRPAGPGPRNMASDGIQLQQDFIATTTPALQDGDEPVPTEREEGTDVIDIRMYVDYLCPVCGAFEDTNAAYIESLVSNGAATVEIHPISILDRLSQGTDYSTRSANAVACVADNSPNQFYDFHTALFENQPEENSTGLTDDELVDLASGAGVEGAAAIEECITDQQFSGWVGDATTRALNGPIPNSDIDLVEGTPTVLVNGQQYTGAVDNADDFRAFVLQAAGESFVENTTPTPTPTPTTAP